LAGVTDKSGRLRGHDDLSVDRCRRAFAAEPGKARLRGEDD